MTLRQTIETEKARLEQEIAPLRERLGALERELFDVSRALAAMNGDVIVRRSPMRRGNTLTIKEMAMRLLEARFDADGATTAELVAEMQVTFGRTIKRECLSPQMSRLVVSGDVLHEGKRWLLAPHNMPVPPVSAQEEAS